MTDERTKELMAQCGLPESRSLYSALKQLEIEVRIEYGDTPWQAARATAEQSRDSVIEECARIVEQHQETFTTMSGGEEERHLTTRRHGNQMGMAYANAIRALKSQQDAAIESQRSGNV